MNQTLTYWSFLKNRPTIQSNTRREPEKAGNSQDRQTQATLTATKRQQKNRRQSPTMPKTQRQHARARSTASEPGLISGPAL
jgi:hypothetical protein